ncbi:MAG: glycosyltransferase family 4 protein [Cyclobacteriaceae bacterium]
MKYNKNPVQKILFILPYPVGKAASQRFRFEQYLGFLSQSFQIDHQSFWSDRAWEILYHRGKTLKKFIYLFSGYFRRFALLTKIHQYHAVFIHREAAPLGPPVFEWIISRIFKKKLIFDFDDAIWLPNTTKENKMASWLKWHQKTARICKLSHRVAVGNDWLADYARRYNANVVVIPTTIDTQNQHNRTKHHKTESLPVIGWTGTHSTSKYLLDLLPVLEELYEQIPFKLLVICNKPLEVHLPFIENLMWNKDQEIEQLQSIDIGIMPLRDTVWEQGKCGFKALQYMALGLPAVVSHVGVNSSIIQHAYDGYLCQSNDDWIRFLAELMQDDLLRNKIGQQARKKVTDQYSVIAWRETFLDLFTL